MKFAAILSLASLVAALSACANDYRVRPSDITRFEADCPMAVPGTVAQGLETEGGMAIILTTPSGEVAELQRRARALARAFLERFETFPVNEADLDDAEDRAEDAVDEYGDMVGDDAEDMAERRLDDAERQADRWQAERRPAARITVSDTPTGARLQFEPAPGADLGAWRVLVHAEVDSMNEGKCPVMTRR